MMRVSGMCKSGEHESCGVVMRKPAGGKFLCKCGCHVPVAPPKPVVDEDEDDY